MEASGLSKENQQYLEAKGLRFYPRSDESYHLLKQIGAEGNSIPNFTSLPLTVLNEEGETVKEVKSNCPGINLSRNDEGFRLMCWDWAPGPGPGDFDLRFDTEAATVDFLDSYYFGDNEYFEARKQYVLQSRNSINVKELELLFSKLLTTLKTEFSDEEIDFGKRSTFHKIPVDSWQIQEFQSEEPTIKVGMGFLQNEVFRLRKKLDGNEDFDFEDINHLSDLLFGLSVLLKQKNNP